MKILHESSIKSNSLNSVRERAEVLANHPKATESINGLARIVIKTVKRIPYDPDASFLAMLLFDRLARLAKGEHFPPEIYKGAFSASRGRI